MSSTAGRAAATPAGGYIKVGLHSTPVSIRAVVRSCPHVRLLQQTTHRHTQTCTYACDNNCSAVLSIGRGEARRGAHNASRLAPGWALTTSLDGIAKVEVALTQSIQGRSLSHIP